MRSRQLVHIYTLCLITVTGSGCSVFTPGTKLWNSAANVDVTAITQTEAKLALQSAQLSEQQGKTENAIRFYEQAKTLNPEWKHLSRRLAVLYDKHGNHTRAKAAYEEALVLFPDDVELLNDYGVYHMHRERWTDAESLFRRTLQITPHHERANVNLGMSLAMQNRLQESYEAFATVVGPGAAVSNIGVLLTRQGRIKEARNYFSRALIIDRSLQQPAEFLNQLDEPSDPLVDSK
jgi:Tfp pilus assembly protein PilF